MNPAMRIKPYGLELSAPHWDRQAFWRDIVMRIMADKGVSFGKAPTLGRGKDV